MKIETDDPGLAKCFSNGELTSADSAWLTREARKRICWDSDAFRDFEDQYREEVGADWDGDRLGLLLTTEPVPTKLTLIQFLQLSGFPDPVAIEQADRVVQTRQRWLDHPPIRTGLLVALRAPTGGGGREPLREVTMRGPAKDQALLARAFAPSARGEDIADLVQSACDHVADRCGEDPELTEALLASDWGSGLSSPLALRSLPLERSPAASGGPDQRALVELSLYIYLERHGFADSTGEMGSRLADSWPGGSPDLSRFRFVRGPMEDDVFEKTSPLGGASIADGGRRTTISRFAAPPSFLLADFRTGGGQPTPPPSPPVSGGPEMLDYPIKVPRGMKTEEELDRYAEVIIFGRVLGLSWKKLGWDVPRFAQQGKVVHYRYPASMVQRNGGRKVSEAVRPPARNPAYDSATGAKKDALNREIDGRYWEGAGVPKGERIKPGEQAKADMWNLYRDEVMRDQQKLKDLPPELSDLMGSQSSFEPADYTRLLRIAEKLKQFSPEDMALFKMVAVRTAHDLDLFERSVNLFLARKEELRQALAAQNAPPPGTPPDTMQAAIDASWAGIDLSQVGKMSEADQYALARKQTWQATKAQLGYMARHPGEVAADFAKSATLMNTGETFDAIGKDIAEAANGDANGWARWAAGTGAGAKLSGWLLAVGGVLYVLSWLTGIGELATIAAFMGIMLASAIVLSTAESELRIKAASQAKNAEEFKRNVNKAAAARLNALIMAAMLVLALAIRAVAKTVFPETMKNLETSLTRLRERVRIVGKLADKKAEIVTELRGHRGRLLEAGEAAKKAARAQADAIEAMSLDEFIATMESGELFPEASTQAGQKIPWTQLASTPEGRQAIEGYRQRVVAELKSGVLKEIDGLVKEQTDAIDATLDKVDRATLPDELAKALKEHESFLKDDEVAARGRVREKRAREKAAQDALGFKDPSPPELRTIAEDLRRPVTETDPVRARAKRADVINDLRNVHGAERPPKYDGYVFDQVLAENQAALAKSRAVLRATNPDVIVGMERGGAFLTEALAKGDPVLAAKVRKMPVYKAPEGASKASKFDEPKQQAEFQKLIDAGAKKITIYDAYMGGRTANSLLRLFRALAKKNPGVTFEIYWLRETFGLRGAEVVGPEKLSGTLGENSPLKDVITTRAEPVSLVLGDDMDVVLSPDGQSSIRIFDSAGNVIEVVTPKPGQTTRQAMIDLLNRPPQQPKPAGGGAPALPPIPAPPRRQDDHAPGP